LIINWALLILFVLFYDCWNTQTVDGMGAASKFYSPLTSVSHTQLVTSRVWDRLLSPSPPKTRTFHNLSPL
jgi:hypothetical protein